MSEFFKNNFNNPIEVYRNGSFSDKMLFWYLGLSLVLLFSSVMPMTTFVFYTKMFVSFLWFVTLVLMLLAILFVPEMNKSNKKEK